MFGTCGCQSTDNADIRGPIALCTFLDHRHLPFFGRGKTPHMAANQFSAQHGLRRFVPVG